mmetsp:Transcript_14364/g.30401  ORF Transcript_14364/g.30401 Transcript_14364/m.30401 type:complete len:309 (-) Transcript_14364:87-1013(-)
MSATRVACFTCLNLIRATRPRPRAWSFRNAISPWRSDMSLSTLGWCSNCRGPSLLSMSVSSAKNAPGLTVAFHVKWSPSICVTDLSVRFRKLAYSSAPIVSVHMSASSKRASRKSFRPIVALPFESRSQSSCALAMASLSLKLSSTIAVKTHVKIRMYSWREIRSPSPPAARMLCCAVCHQGSSASRTSGCKRSRNRSTSRCSTLKELWPCRNLGTRLLKSSSETAVTTCDVSTVIASFTFAFTLKSERRDCISTVAAICRQPRSLTELCAPGRGAAFPLSGASAAIAWTTRLQRWRSGGRRGEGRED